MSANEAIARGAWEGGCKVATGYPGTPSTEILENIVQYKKDLYCEWSPNEKVAFEVAVGSSLAGARSIVTMKHVGLNVAADPLMTFAYMGSVGGFVAIVADDPGMHSSQNEQDTRNFAKFAKIPVLEPSDSQEALDFVKYGFEISEKYTTPVILRSTTRVSHSRSLVELNDRITPPLEVKFEKNPPRFVPIPAWARQMRVRLEDRLAQLKEAAETSSLNRIEWRDRELGIITHSVSYQYVRDIFPEASVLKIGFSYPYPDKLFKDFAAGVKRVLVVEELDDFMEEHIKSLGIACDGKNIIPRIGELTPNVLAACRAKMEGREPEVHNPVAQALDLPNRPPVLCAGCPHRGIFYALAQEDVIVTGDIGCYSLGVAPPLGRMDTILCMGAGFTVAHGMDKAGEKKKIVGMVGDSTFFHSGITGMLDIVYNKGISTLVVVDNRITAMTGHQDNPGTGQTLMGEKTVSASIEAIAKACGFEEIHVVDPYDQETTCKAVKESISSNNPSLIISRAPCILHEKKPVGPMVSVNDDICVECGQCLDLGCPGIEARSGHPHINEILCGGCQLCVQVCPCSAINPVEVK